MRLLITGSTGFIGQNLLPEIVKRFPDIDILTINRDIEKAAEMFPFWQCCHCLTSTINQKTVKEFDPEIVFHLATLTSAENDPKMIKPMIDANITFGTRLLNVLSASPSLKLFVNVGSFSEYRSGYQKIDDAYLYSATKSAFRVLVDFYSNWKGFKYITAVPYSVYGGKPTVKRLMDYIMESVNSPTPVEMTAGEQKLDFIHVADVVLFFIQILENTSLSYSLPNGEEFHLGTGKATSIREVVGMVERISGKKCNIAWGARPYRERDLMYAVAPTTKNSNLLKWDAGITLEEGLKMLGSLLLS